VSGGPGVVEPLPGVVEPGPGVVEPGPGVVEPGPGVVEPGFPVVVFVWGHGRKQIFPSHWVQLGDPFSHDAKHLSLLSMSFMQ